jgi:hypothetical protein
MSKLFDSIEIEPNDYIRGWNSMGDGLKASFLDHIFKPLENENDLVLHNHFVWHINELLGDKGDEFKKQVSLLIEELSLRNIEHGTKKRQTTQD